MNEDKLIEDNRGLVKSIVVEFHPRNVTEYEEYEQAGLIGLMKAIRKYNPAKSKLSTYAFYYIHGEISRYIKQEKGGQHSLGGFDQLIQPSHTSIMEYFGNLTPTETSIIDMYASGYSFKAIGDKFGHNRSWANRIYKDLVKKIRKNYV